MVTLYVVAGGVRYRAFKELGLSVHKRFDEIATEADLGASRERMLASLGTQLSACVACHASYRIGAAPPAAK